MIKRSWEEREEKRTRLSWMWILWILHEVQNLGFTIDPCLSGTFWWALIFLGLWIRGYIYILYSIPFKAAMQSPLDFIFLFFWWKFPMQHHDLPTIRASRSSASRTCLELLGWISRLPRDPSGPGILDFSPLTIGLWSNKHGISPWKTGI